MSFLGSIFENKSIQNMALGALKKIMKERSVTRVSIIQLPGTEDFDFEFHKEGDTMVSAADLKKYRAAMNYCINHEIDINE